MTGSRTPSEQVHTILDSRSLAAFTNRPRSAGGARLSASFRGRGRLPESGKATISAGSNSLSFAPAAVSFLYSAAYWDLLLQSEEKAGIWKRRKLWLPDDFRESFNSAPWHFIPDGSENPAQASNWPYWVSRRRGMNGIFAACTEPPQDVDPRFREDRFTELPGGPIHRQNPRLDGKSEQIGDLARYPFAPGARQAPPTAPSRSCLAA
jgi:hypothetical protein